ncbi:hypothetical protein GO491_02600 [Flavobacteriaceae bacterium Ap0902]|nr:hypothetical protein [Flavobacteriaceae bacterium Ap0902]
MLQEFKKFQILYSYDLKIIALITMIIYHLGMMFFPEAYYLRITGRVAFLVYAFMLVDGVFYTRSIKKSKVLLWVFLSEIPYNLFLISF